MFVENYNIVTALIMVLFSAPPSELTNAIATDIGSDTVTLSLMNPSFIGLPHFSVFMVELNAITRTFTASNTDPSLTNTLTVDSLQPNTSYSVRVRAVSTHPNIRDLLGKWSSAVTFKTTLGGEFSYYSVQL